MQNNTILNEGKNLYTQKKYDKALAFFLGLPTDSPADKIEVSYYLGLCYTKLERYDDALLFLEQVVTSGGNLERTLQCRFLLAVIYALSGRKRLADFELNKLLETGYMTASVYAAIAFVAWEQNDTERCLNYYEKSLHEDPDNVSSLNCTSCKFGKNTSVVILNSRTECLCQSYNFSRNTIFRSI